MGKFFDAVKDNLIWVLFGGSGGFFFLWLAIRISDMQLYALLTSIGAAFVVTALSRLLLSITFSDSKEIFEAKIEKLTDKLDVLPEAKKCKIVHIFESRRKDDRFQEELVKQFNNVKDGSRVLMMGNSLRDFFGDRRKKGYSNLILEMVKRDVEFKILLLDPISPAAKKRAHIEEREILDNRCYIKSTLFKEIKNVADWLNNPIYVSQNEKNKIRQNMEVRFSPYDPTTQLTRTDKYTFVEQYHKGGDDFIRKDLESEGINFIDCFGGFVPVLMLENSSQYAKLLESHFYNTWKDEEVVKRDLRTHLKKIENFEEEEWKKLSKSQPLLSMNQL